MPTTRDTAKHYASLGYSVLPLRPDDKRPGLSQWKALQEKPWGVKEINDFWGQNPNHGVGIITGKISGISVIDIDDPQRAAKAFKNAGISPPKTFTVITRKGVHLYYKYDADFAQGAGRLDAVDIRNDGGYVVAPPTVIAAHEYTIKTDMEPVEFGEVPVELMAPQGTKETTADINRPDWIAEALLKGAGEGQRNDTAMRLAAYFHSRGEQKDIIRAMLRQYADNCEPVFSYAEVDQVVESVTQRYKQSPVQTFYKGTLLEKPLIDLTTPRRRIFRWPDSGLSVELDHINEARDGITAWITVSKSGLGEIYGPIRMNLLSVTARAAFIRELKDRDEHDWASVIQHISRLTIDTMREEQPFIALSTHKAEHASPWLLRPFIRAGQPTTFYADGGTGKSTLADAICLSIASGQSVIPGTFVTERTNVLIGDWETDPTNHKMIIDAMMKGRGMPTYAPNEIYYRRFDGPLPDYLDELQRFVIEHNIGFMVIDSIVAAAAGDDVNSDGAARSYFNTMRSLNIPYLGITHTPQSGDRIYGNRFFWNLTRMAWLIERAEDTSTVALFNKKTMWETQKPMGLQVEYAMRDTGDGSQVTDAITFKNVDVATDPQLAKGLPLIDQIKHALTRGVMAPKDIADETGIKDATVRQYLARGLKSGIFIKDATTGNYGLAAGVESPLPVTPAVTPESVTPAVTPPVDDPSMWWIDDK
jgi:hypothetical protein